MARITFVKKALPRYKTVPVIDAVTGEQKVTPVMRRDGTQKVTKHGKPVVMRVTIEDKSQPLPPHTCELCRKPIEPGTSYKHVSPKSGPYGGQTRRRCATCPTWKSHELSNAWWARIEAALEDFTFPEDATCAEDISGVLEGAAEAIRGLAEESRETASNIEDGFGHPTQQSQEAEERADALEGWADEMENTEIEDAPEQDDDGYEPEEPAEEESTAETDEDAEADSLGAEGAEEEPAGESDDAFQERLDAWREEQRSNFDAAMEANPL